jgi:undecaprenyl-diphosphatase
VVAGTWAFLQLADRVTEGPPPGFDAAILRALRRPDDPGKLRGPELLEEVARDLTALGGVALLSLVTAAVGGYLALHRKYHALIFLVCAVGGGLLVSTLLKNAFDRPRPQVVPHLSIIATSSFPSGHSMLSAVTYLTLGGLLARLSPRQVEKVYFLGVALLLTGLTGFSRLLMGVHWPTDVLGGWAAGLVWSLLCWLTVRYLQHRGAVERTLTEGET